MTDCVDFVCVGLILERQEVLSYCANVYPFLQFLHTVVVHCSCLAFRIDSAMFVSRTPVKFTSSILIITGVSQCIMINYN